MAGEYFIVKIKDMKSQIEKKKKKNPIEKQRKNEQAIHRREKCKWLINTWKDPQSHF